MTLAFTITGSFLAWKVGIGSNVRVGVDSIICCNMNIYLLEVIINDLWVNGKLTLNQVANLEETTLWRQYWLSTDNIVLEDHLDSTWDLFLFELHKYHT